VPGSSWRDRLGLTLGARRLIDLAGWGDAERVHMQGDASSRAYERLVRPDGETAVLMISPPRPDGPPVRAGKPYSAIARLAERVDAFIAIDKGLRALDLSAPRILASDIVNGLLLIEDLGSEGVLADGAPIPERYELAAEVLASIHARQLPTILPVSDGRDHVIPDYDEDALTIESELLLDWYVPHIGKRALPNAARADFGRLWRPLLRRVGEAQRTWTLRDYHSPNLIWLPEREGLRKVGLIDFQDAVLGHPAYDVVSLAQDARVDIPPDLELRLIGAYARARRAANPDFDLVDFAEAYAILGAQRATKILGIFARLDKRDGKPAYLRHLPRIEAYLRRNFAHPALQPLKAWHEMHLPALFTD
jgi:aminoglycoside/choline kinase family phosphotransferase